MSLSAPAPEALLFDCDGTLVDSLPLYLDAWLDSLKTLAGLHIPPGWFGDKGGLSELRLLETVEREFGVSFDHAAFLGHAREGVLARMKSVDEMLSVTRIVRRFAGRLPVAVVSNGPRDVVTASLQAVGLHDLFPVIVTVEDVQKPKPAPDPYLLAARMLEVAPENCIVFEDSSEGLTAARAAGMRAVNVRIPDWEATLWKDTAPALAGL
ncbi:HAD family phosphatase [Acetobacter sp. AN02]|uniref:HAD family hydrolase n=1 Tax=Acetobacter sp. AN02 TaxID=2894186 RepID=UPI0024342FCB|nr:HAD family phosphatase [Acetobacter sp. AN02]MDG6093634.1 HAD family phosphatase [Acetobacter sp. AN02]